MFKASRLIHWIAAASILMSAIAPTVSQAISVAQNGQGFAMEVCSADGTVQVFSMEESTAPQVESKSCSYCLVQAVIPPAFQTQLQFQDPQQFAFFPALFYQSPKPLAVWVMPPSAAPPASA
jgi:hypothetical protein